MAWEVTLDIGTNVGGWSADDPTVLVTGVAVRIRWKSLRNGHEMGQSMNIIYKTMWFFMIFPFRTQSGGWCPADGRIEAQGHVIRPPSKRFSATKVVFFTQQTTNTFNKDQHHCISCKNRGKLPAVFTPRFPLYWATSGGSPGLQRNARDPDPPHMFHGFLYSFLVGSQWLLLCFYNLECSKCRP